MNKEEICVIVKRTLKEYSINRENDVYPKTYTILTKKDSKSMRLDGYHFKVFSLEEIKKLKIKYPIGGIYNNELIIATGVNDGKFGEF